MNGIIRLENVIKMYPGGQRAINDVSFSIHERERVEFHGTSGSGKSTLMRLIAGMEAPSAGKIFVMDRAVHEMDSDTASVFRNRNIGTIQRESGFMERLTVIENVAIPLVLRGIPVFQRYREAKEQLKVLGLEYATHAYPSQLSAYEARVASVAQVLIARPGILLLDDIVASLSAKETGQLTDLINDIGKSGDFTVLYFCTESNQNLSADRCFKLDHGKIQEDRS